MRGSNPVVPTDQSVSNAYRGGLRPKCLLLLAESKLQREAGHRPRAWTSCRAEGLAPESYGTDALRPAPGREGGGAAGVDCQCIPARPR
jgi:hypothetical protein